MSSQDSSLFNHRLAESKGNTMNINRNLSVSSIAMASSINWSRLLESNNSEGALELFQELSQYSEISTAMFNEITTAINCDYKGCYLYEVDEDFAAYFAKKHIEKKYFPEDCKLTLGRYCHEFFEMTPATLSVVAPIVFKFTGYRISTFENVRPIQSLSSLTVCAIAG